MMDLDSDEHGMATYRQALILQEGTGPSRILVLHHDGEASRIEISSTAIDGIVLVITLAQGHQFHIERPSHEADHPRC